VSEIAEYCEKVPCNSTRPYADFVLGGSVTDMCPSCALRNMPQEFGVTDMCPTRAPRNMPKEFGFHSLLLFVSPQF
jgi:hypothetical protein